jgi:hypothetical protein
MKTHETRTPLNDLEEFDKFEVITKYQKKHPLDVLNNFMKQYNEKYKELYDKALDSFWNE